ncbi:hypothetical protein Lepto7376_4094 [[Leptolyngbya] sp. PCC 7376]|uniref:protein phosphatase 2C domain-containing protein n=1 Tax=[Leptolyngbya] sp. PCC 7376 TaxID=111781 RepID=UPI00029F4421|nr:protein phosphatase 2C domain-containing protein [[Leptolyngbya] sp. PCC 7376]AFY40223.1 hypothetical protein Lepto7376_4094 [[Leptolyngbya] sp. PCC 7376]
MDGFEWAAGSVIGKEHRRVNKNNQDAIAIKSATDYAIGIVADGCGSKAHSEVGAWLAVELLAEAIATHLPQPLTKQKIEEFGQNLLQNFPALPNFQNYYLFTLLGFVVTEEQSVIFGCGDGIYAINDEIKQISYEDNAPPYLIYPETKLEIYAEISTEDLNSLFIGTDGIEEWIQQKELSEFWQSDKYFKNPDQIRRTLAIAQKKESLSKDDTTLITLRHQLSVD